MENILKIILYCDEGIYQKIFDAYSYYDDESDSTYHFFNRNNYDIKHIRSNKYINFSINPLTGYRNITHCIIQKSFYKNVDIINIMRKFKLINPNVKMLLLLDDDPKYYPVLLNIIAKEKLCSVAFDISDLKKWFENGAELFDHSSFLLKKVSKKLKKQFIEN